MDSKVKLVCIIEYSDVHQQGVLFSRIRACLNHRVHQKRITYILKLSQPQPSPKMPEYACRLFTITHPGSATRLHMVSTTTIFPAEVASSQMRNRRVHTLVIKKTKAVILMIIIWEQLKIDKCVVSQKTAAALHLKRTSNVKLVTTIHLVLNSLN